MQYIFDTKHMYIYARGCKVGYSNFVIFEKTVLSSVRIGG